MFLDQDNSEQRQTEVIHITSLCCTHTTGACPSRRPRTPPARRGRSSCSRTGSGRAGSAASTSSAPATRTPGSGTASPPTVSSGGRGRQLGSPPGPGPGGGGGAAASGHRRRRPSSSHRRQVARAAPFGAEAGGGRSGGSAAFSSPPRPFPVQNANASSSSFHPEHVQMQEGRSPCPMSGGGRAMEAGERLPFRTFTVAAAWAHNGGISGETSERGYWSLATPRWGPAGLPVFPCRRCCRRAPSTTPWRELDLIVQIESQENGN